MTGTGLQEPRELVQGAGSGRQRGDAELAVDRQAGTAQSPMRDFVEE